mgnify:CR=1 FL=1
MSLKSLFAGGLLALTMFLGCGETDALNRQRVTGEIKLNGTPIANGSIEFAPVGEGTSGGAAIENGKFEIVAERGLPPGEYIVRINAASESVDAGEMPGDSSILAEELVPPEYNTDSKLKFTVKPEGENVFNQSIETAAK